MQNVTLSPAMGRYLNMVNNKSVAKTGFPANENYARELMQLFTLGLTQLNPDGTPSPSAASPLPTYTEDDVKALARILTGWTYGDGNPGTVPGGTGGTNYGVPMEAVAASSLWHDTTAKTFLGQSFGSGGTATAELNRALDIIFSQPTLPVFVSRQLIQQLVTSNPKPRLRAGGRSGVQRQRRWRQGRSLPPVVRAILMHPEALASNDTVTMSGKLSEPVLFITSTMRAFQCRRDRSSVHDRSVGGSWVSAVFYPGSVFSYFSPGFRVRGTNNGTGAPILGPEFQGLTTVHRARAGQLRRGSSQRRLRHERDHRLHTLHDQSHRRGNARRPSAPKRSWAAASPRPRRTAIIAAVNVTPVTDAFERARTAIYLTLTRRRPRSIARRESHHESEESPSVSEELLCRRRRRNGGAVSRLAPMSLLAQSAGDYKALVCVFLFGGNDANNMIIPIDSRHAAYRTMRGSVALPAPDAANPDAIIPAGSSGYGLHPRTATVEGRYDTNRVAMVFNAGTLFEPMTRTEYRKRHQTAPVALFSHSDQTQQCADLDRHRRRNGMGWTAETTSRRR
jgi:hypothetical protein